MPKPTKGPRLGGTPAHERIILANLASQLFEHGRITTTETKAKRGDLHNRRQVLTVVTDKSIVDILFHEIAPQMAGRDGGYTRITKIGPRKGDNAPMAILELVTEAVAAKAAAAPATAADAKAEIQALADVDAAAETTEVEAAEVAETAEVEAAEGKEYGEGSFRGAEAPEGFDIKGNEDSMKFHTPESPWYDRTIAEVWFNSAEAAEAAGFVNAVQPKDEA